MTVFEFRNLASSHRSRINSDIPKVIGIVDSLALFEDASRISFGKIDTGYIRMQFAELESVLEKWRNYCNEIDNAKIDPEAVEE